MRASVPSISRRARASSSARASAPPMRAADSPLSPAAGAAAGARAGAGAALARAPSPASTPCSAPGAGRAPAAGRRAGGWFSAEEDARLAALGARGASTRLNGTAVASQP